MYPHSNKQNDPVQHNIESYMPNFVLQILRRLSFVKPIISILFEEILLPKKGGIVQIIQLTEILQPIAIVLTLT